jgi:hypothetical protein
MGRNVTVRRPVIGRPFTGTSIRCTILPGDDNYRDYLNAGIMDRDGIVMGAGDRPADGHARGNRR